MSVDRVDAGNLFAALPDARAGEAVDTLLDRPGVRLHRIVSAGQATPDDDWYDQADDEWVVVLQGAAAVLIEGEAAARPLGPGDWLYLPARCRHRVAATDPATPTVWLALHVDKAGAGTAAG